MDDHAYQARINNNITEIFCRLEYFTNSVFPYTIKEWNKLSLEMRYVGSNMIFKRSLLDMKKMIANSVLTLPTYIS